LDPPSRLRYSETMPRKYKRVVRPELDDEMARRGLIPVPEAADLLGLSPPRVYALADAGELQVERVGIGRRAKVYVSRASIESHVRGPTLSRGLVPLAQAMRVVGCSRATIYRRYQVETVRGRAHVWLNDAED